MARPKIARKSTSIDMTAMCDVAFLLLSFFILTAKAKPSEAVAVITPSSVSSKVAPDKDVLLITLNKEGKVFLTPGDNASDKNKMELMLNSLNTSKNIGLSNADIANLVKAPVIGASFGQLKQTASLPPEQLTDKVLPGIPAQDTTNNQMIDWLHAVAEVYAGIKVNILLKGDNAAKYPAFKNILTALKKNDLMKFQMVTNPESAPVGTELYRLNMSGKKPDN